MTRIIKASEVKPGMEVQIITRMKIRLNILRIGPQQEMRDESGHVVRVDADTPVTVLSEPAPAQPEEPTEFGAKVAVAGCPAVRVNTRSSETGIWALEPVGQEPLLKTWAALLEMGDVVIPDQGWTVPAETELTPEVPDRIEEWPEDDTALRPYPWRDTWGREWRHCFTGIENGWSSAGRFPGWKKPIDGPWERVSDA